MTNLLGTANLCKQVVGTQAINTLNKFVYPNPFISYIHVFPEYERDLFYLINGVGHIVYLEMILYIRIFQIWRRDYTSEECK